MSVATSTVQASTIMSFRGQLLLIVIATAHLLTQPVDSKTSSAPLLYLNGPLMYGTNKAVYDSKWKDVKSRQFQDANNSLCQSTKNAMQPDSSLLRSWYKCNVDAINNNKPVNAMATVYFRTKDLEKTQYKPHSKELINKVTSLVKAYNPPVSAVPRFYYDSIIIRSGAEANLFSFKILFTCLLVSTISR